MTRLKIFILMLFFIVLYPLLISEGLKADELSGGEVLFGDEEQESQQETPNRNQNALQQEQNNLNIVVPAVPKAPSVPVVPIIPTGVKQQNTDDNKDKSKQTESKQTNIKPNYIKIDKDSILDSNTMFKPNTKSSLFGVNFLVIRINTKTDRAGKVIGLLREGAVQPTTYISELEDPDYFLNIEKQKYKIRDYSQIELYNSHKVLLDELLSSVPVNKDTIVIMYVNGSSLKTVSDKQMQVEKTVYAQLITNYLYIKRKKLRIERRYMEDIPEDEILMIVSQYEGSYPVNLYNASKGDIIQWLSKYKDLEKKKIKLANEARVELEKNIEEVANSKDDNLYVVAIEEGEEKQKDLFKIDKDAIAEKRIIPPKSNITPSVSKRVKRFDIGELDEELDLYINDEFSSLTDEEFNNSKNAYSSVQLEAASSESTTSENAEANQENSSSDGEEGNSENADVQAQSQQGQPVLRQPVN